MTTEPSAFRMRIPAHPGTFIQHDIIEPTGLSLSGAASVLGVDGVELASVLDQRSQLTPEMALRIEKAFGVSMETLMRMQNSFDIAQVRQRESEIAVERYQPAANAST